MILNHLAYERKCDKIKPILRGRLENKRFGIFMGYQHEAMGFFILFSGRAGVRPPRVNSACA